MRFRRLKSRNQLRPKIKRFLLASRRDCPAVPGLSCRKSASRSAERNAGLADEERMVFRVGINLGDVVIDGEDIKGDG